MSELNEVAENASAYLTFQYSDTKKALEVPAYVVGYLKSLFGNMAEGKAVQVAVVETELSTQDAADILGVSRPHLVKLLEQGKIPFKKVGRHRRVALEDLQAYERRQQAVREKQLNFIAAQAQDLNLGYEL